MLPSTAMTGVYMLFSVHSRKIVLWILFRWGWEIGGDFSFLFVCFSKSCGEWWAWMPLPVRSTWEQHSFLTLPFSAPRHPSPTRIPFKGRPHFLGGPWESTWTKGKTAVLAASWTAREMLFQQGAGRAQWNNKKSACALTATRPLSVGHSCYVKTDMLVPGAPQFWPWLPPYMRTKADHILGGNMFVTEEASKSRR